MKKNALILSIIFGLSILISTPKIEAFNKKYLALGAAVILGLILIKKLIKKETAGKNPLSNKKNNTPRSCRGVTGSPHGFRLFDDVYLLNY